MTADDIKALVKQLQECSWARATISPELKPQWTGDDAPEKAADALETLTLENQRLRVAAVAAQERLESISAAPDERARFEAAYLARYPAICAIFKNRFERNQDNPDEYEMGAVHVAWEMWQVCVAVKRKTDSQNDGDMRKQFDAWHNRFYGPQSKYNLIRNLDKVEPIGYIDSTVNAQYCAFVGAWKAASEMRQELLEEIDRKAQAGLCCMNHGGTREFLKDIRELISNRED
jgi:hypothetical protein